MVVLLASVVVFRSVLEGDEMKIESNDYERDINELLGVLIEVRKWMSEQGILKSKTMNKINEILKKYKVN
jgi:hypothetical protein